jgi:hypothetical protein
MKVIIRINVEESMKKIAIALMATVSLLAANAYACGNHNGADTKASKADNSSACNVGMSEHSMTCQPGAQTSEMSPAGKTKVMTTEYRSNHNVLGAKGTPLQVANIGHINPAVNVYRSPIKNEGITSYYGGGNNYGILVGVFNLTAFYQQ